MTTRRFRPRKIPTLITLALLAVLIALGCWQLQRQAWKTALIASIEEKMAAAPAPLPEKIENPDEWEYRRVTMAGWFLHPHEAAIGPRTLDGKAGVRLFTPFRRASGGLVYVDRGWVPDEMKDKAQRPEGLGTIAGIVRLTNRPRYAPDNDAGKGDWYWPDIAALAATAKLDAPAPVYVEAEKGREGAFPVGGGTILDIPNNHRNYAIFWFAMALILCVVYTVSSFTATEE